MFWVVLVRCIINSDISIGNMRLKFISPHEITQENESTKCMVIVFHWFIPLDTANLCHLKTYKDAKNFFI